MRARAVARHTDDRGTAARELRVQVAEIAGFAGAAGGIVLGVEIQHDPLVLQVGELKRVARLGGAGEFGDLGADFDRHVAFASIPDNGSRFRRDDGRRKFALQNLTGSMIASRFKPSHISMNSSRSSAMRVSAGMPTVICAWNMSAPVCIAW